MRLLYCRRFGTTEIGEAAQQHGGGGVHRHVAGILTQAEQAKLSNMQTAQVPVCVCVYVCPARPATECECPACWLLPTLMNWHIILTQTRSCYFMPGFIWLQVHVDPKIHFDDPRLLEHLLAGGTQAALIHEFLIVLSVCHTVIPELVSSMAVVEFCGFVSRAYVFPLRARQ